MNDAPFPATRNAVAEFRNDLRRFKRDLLFVCGLGCVMQVIFVVALVKFG